MLIILNLIIIAFSREKKAFLQCLRSHGFNVVYDMETLKSILPERSATEIKYLIDIYSRKGRDLYRNYQEEAAASEQPNAFKKPPIQAWYNIVHHAVPGDVKKDDMSAIYGEVLEEISQQIAETMESEEPVPSTSDAVDDVEAKPNYSRLYFYLSEVLKGRFPPQLSALDSYVIMQLMDSLTETIVSDQLVEEKV